MTDSVDHSSVIVPGTAGANVDAVPVGPAPSPGMRIWRRFLSTRGGKIGAVLVSVFALIAFLAPFLAHRLPFYWHDSATGQISFPLIREFFSPSDTTEPMLEKGINFLFIYIPLALLAWKAMTRWFPRLGGAESRSISLLFGLLFSALLWFAIGGMVVQGGGNDWFHHEEPPVPEMNDIESPEALLAAYAVPSASPYAKAVRNALAQDGLNVEAVRSVIGPGNIQDERNRLLGPHLQNIVDGPPLLPDDGFGDPASYNINTLDITADTLHIGINTQRWNRIVLENAFPGMLIPFRQFRASFVMLASLCLLVLLGLTYIFMAGANQFSLSPRWLLLLGLAALVSLLFSRQPYHNHTQYRALAEKGAGSGIFPLAPYGPNEQGFGPLLPPSWRQPAAFLSTADVISWDRFASAIERPANAGAGAIQNALEADGFDATRIAAAAQAKEADENAAVIAALNSIIATPDFFSRKALAWLPRDRNTSPYLNDIESGITLNAVHQTRLNRLAVERSLPAVFLSASAGQWKKPGHSPAVHLLGTDESGRDVLVRLVHGARVSLSVGFVSVFLATVIGLVLGSLAAFYGGWVDMAISRFMEIMMCFPSFFLILAVIAVLDRRSIVNIMLVIGLTSWTGVARLTRGEMLRQKKMDYVAASIALGAPDTRTIFRHILPNAMAPVLVSISFGITDAILTEASLSFIGFGVTPPTPTWGQLLSETRNSPLLNWWLAVFPGIVLFLGVLAYNLVGEALRDAMDPRQNM